MKRFTVLFLVFLVLSFCGVMVWVSRADDFTPPASTVGEGEDPNAPVWELPLDELISYLEERGLWERDEMDPLSEGIATEAYTCHGAELYWWDLDRLQEGSHEANAYAAISRGEMIDLWDQGQYYLSVTKNGPFALNAERYEGDVKQLLDAFITFGQ